MKVKVSIECFRWQNKILKSDLNDEKVNSELMLGQQQFKTKVLEKVLVAKYR